MIATALSDAELLEHARQGDESAFTELYVRHQAAARRLANSYRRAGDPDDLVNGAFERVLGALRRGAGPTESFRAYLFVTLRRLAAENISRSKDDPFEEVPEPVEAEARAPALDSADREIVLQAFESIPERSQTVLWHTAVEGRDPKDLAPVLGMSANATAALAYRAREKLRQAYLQAHLQASPRPRCEPHRSRLGAFVREGLSRRDQTATEQHLDGCESCRGLVAELLDINRVLNGAIFPLFAASAADVAALAGGAAAGGAAATGASGPLRIAKQGYSKARNNPAGSMVAAGALAVALAAGLIAMQNDGEDPPPGTSAGTPEEVEESAAPAPSDDPPPDEAPEPPPPEDEPPEPEPQPEPEPEEPPADEPPPMFTDSPPAPEEPAPEETPQAPPPEEPAQPEPTTTTPPPPPPEPPVPLGPVVWNASADTLDITLTNSGSASTDYMLLNVTLAGGAVVRGGPSGCDLAVAVLVTAECGISPVPPGSTKQVRLPVTATSPGQRATVSQCMIGLLRLACSGPILRTTTVGLE